MDKISINEWKGLYTNVDEARLNPEFQSKAFNVRFKTGYMESDGYTRLPIEDSSNVIYMGSVRLDEDRLGSKITQTGEEIIPDYTQSYRDYLFIQYSNFTIALKAGGITFPIEGELDSQIKKIIEIDGNVKILCESGTLYHLGRIKRYFKEGIGSINKSLYLVKAIDLDSHINVSVTTSNQDAEVEKEVYFKYIRTEIIEINGVNYWRHLFEEYDEVGLITPEVWFLAPIGTIPPPPRLEAYMWITANFLADYTPINMPWTQIRQPSLDDPANNRYGVRTGNFIAATFRTMKPISVTDYGFDKKDFEFLVTTVYDDANEYVISSKKGSTAFTKYFIKLETSIHEDFNKRITGFNFYLRFNKYDDFQLVKSYNLTLGKPTEEIDGALTSLMLTGIYLSQTIGFVYDIGALYRPVTSFNDYIQIAGIAYGIYQSRVYYCSVGKGQIMKEVFYDYIPEAEGEFLADINGYLGVFSSQLDIIVAQDSGEGYLLFSFKDSLNFSIRDQYDLATSPEGIIIHTERGIYVTNGYERKLISEQINDIVERNYATGNIFYDDTNDVLFYICNEGSFRYDFVYPQWVEIFPNIKGTLSFGYDGKIYQLIDKKVYKLNKSDSVVSYIETPKIDLEYPDIAKNIMYIIIDFVGRLILYLEDQVGETITYDITHSVRKPVKLGVPVGMRTPSSTLGTAFAFIGKVYSEEIYYDILGEFRNEDFIPSPETYFKGDPLAPKLIESVKEQAKTSSQW